MARKILLADDSVTAQNMGRKILADAGYEVLTVNNGSAALKKIAEAKPELIVLDVYMPGYSGLEVCQRLKEAGETARIPVLLTVGKLEPFKPEEARRVRADGFIVKPFEASELLSALSKLEDKIVPGREAHKPGRFARANAALDSYDKTVAIEEDSSWKNRISFPSKKKKVVEEDGDDPAIYNAVNKDLRTVVDRKPAAPPEELRVEPEKVNLEALAPEGLPKDVTPEEIAAFAAAAAQMKSSTPESKAVEEPPKPIAPAVDAKPAESNNPAAKPETPEIKAEHRTAEVPKQTEETVPATVTEKIEDKPAALDKAAENETSLPTPNPAEVMAAIAALEPEPSPSPTSQDGVLQEPVEEPITMAVAAGAEYSAPVSRWTAVPVALAPDEIAISLEHEMQKAHAAFAAAEMAHSNPISDSQPTVPDTPVSEASSPLEPPTPEPAISVSPEPEVAQATSAVAELSTDAIAAAVQELEAVAASYEAQRQQEPAPEPSAPVSEPPQSVESFKEESHSVPAETPQSEAITEVAAAPAPEQPKQEIPAPEIETETKPVEHAPQPHSEESEAVTHEHKHSEDSVLSHVSSHVAEPVASGQIAAGGTGDMGRKESQIAETTAAAWASWRRIREDARSQPSKTSTQDEPRDTAAMAVAAGAEKSPEQASSDGPDAGEIASIVDSVLADLRPKIVEEISRKLGKKK